MKELQSGDFVVVTGSSAFAGKIARLLYRAPDCDFCLPDGHSHIACQAGDWVLEFPQKVPAFRRGCQSPCMTKYLCSPESQLKSLGNASGLDVLFGMPLNAASSAQRAMAV